MEKRPLGRSGLSVTPICLGTMMFGGRTPEADAALIIESAFDAGVNFIDTADQYQDGGAEEIVGRAIKNKRENWVLATKAGNPIAGYDGSGGLSRDWLLKAAEESLRRLGTDRIDLYYLHREDHKTPLEETIEAIGQLLQQGKILNYGVSNFRAWRVAEIARLADQAGIPRPVASQPYYNAMNRMPEVEHLPACHNYGMAVVPYSPLARGVLTGKYSPEGPPPEGSRAGSGDKRMLESEWREESIAIAQKIKTHAEARGMTPGQFAFNWVLNNQFVTAAIAGPRTMAQWQDYLGALSHDFEAEDEAFVDQLVVTGHPSTPGYNDPSYPIEGRVPRSMDR